MATTEADAATVRLARITGVLLLVMAVAAIFAEFGVRTGMVVAGDAEATARNIQASPQLFRAGLFGYLVAFVCDVPVAVLFFLLLRHVGNGLALGAMAFRLVYTAVVGACLLAYGGAVHLLSGESYLSALGAEQLHAQALFFLRLFDQGFILALVFFAFHLILLGWLLFRSRQLPRVFGVLVLLGGASYLIDGTLYYLAPSMQVAAKPVLAVFGMAEVLLALWLVVKGLRPASRSATTAA
jgi:hypothetical protein